MHAQPIHGGQKPLSLGDKILLVVSLGRVQEKDQAAHDRGHRPVAALSFRGQDRLDTGSVPESHPHAGVDGEFLIQGQELAQDVQDGSVLFRGAEDFLLYLRQGGFEPSGDAVYHCPEREDEQFIAAGKIVTHRAHSQPGFIRYFPEGGPLQAITGDDPEYGVDDFLAPGFGINNFGH